MASKTNSTMLITKVESKIYKLTRYDEAIANPIYSCQWKKAIKEKLQNLE